MAWMACIDPVPAVGMHLHPRGRNVNLSQQSRCPFYLNFYKTDKRHAFFAIHTTVTDIEKIAMETVFGCRQNRLNSHQHAVHQRSHARRYSTQR
jgi:hypothetical protein